MEDIIQDIIDLTKKKMREQGVFSHEGFRQLVEENIDYFIEKGKLSDDDDLRFIFDQILGSWQFIEDELTEDNEILE